MRDLADHRPGSLDPESPHPGRTLIHRAIGRHPDVQIVSLVLLFGCATLGLGLYAVASSRDLGFTASGALEGILSQLTVTGPAAVLVAAATAVNIYAGAVVLRLLGAPPFRSLSDLVLGGFATAVILDAAALFLLGSLGLFVWPVLFALHLAAIAAARFALPGRQLLRGRVHLRPTVPAVWWLLIGAIWVGPLIIQLASPAVPFMDVLPNHVAPVEHVRVFGSFSTLTTSPSPIYGPSRLMLGYIGLLGTLTTITRLEAILSVAAFALPITILTAVALRQLATRLFGRVAGFWIMLTFPLTFTFVRIPDARATVVVFPLAAWAMGLLVQQLGSRANSRPGVARSVARPDIGLMMALGAAILVHPLIGAIAAAGAVAAIVIQPGALPRRLIPALGGAAFLALPQAATMLGLGLPAWLGLPCLAAAIPVAWGLALLLARFEPPWRRLAALSFAVAVIGFIVVTRPVLQNPPTPGQALPNAFPQLLLLCALGILLSARAQRPGWTVVGCGAGAGVAIWAAARVVPSQTLFQQAIHYEVPKAVEYWLPVMLALGAAAALTAVYCWRSLGALRPIVLAAFVLVSVFPLVGPLTGAVAIGEHRGAESLGLALREAERGYWVKYPDPRRIINASQQQVVDAIRTEQESGRLRASTPVLHVAASFQQWVSVPIGVFTGALETSISLSPEHSLHTDGGRLLGFDRLDAELATDYGYVVLETAWLPKQMAADLPGRIVRAGYHEIWSNSTAIIYARD